MSWKIPHLRWWIAVLLIGAAVLNYVDRQTLSALAPTIQADLAMDDRAYADVVNLFLIAYTFAFLLSGRLADRLGTRASLTLFVAWWSVANMLTAAAQGTRSLGAYRLLLGLGEAGVWPAASKAVAEWFPARERALAIGLYTMGATLGATLAPFLVIPLATHAWHDTAPVLAAGLGTGAGWRMAFLLTGAAGLLWLVPWLWLYHAPRESRRLTPAEARLLAESAAAETPAGDGGTPWTWAQVLTFRGTWLLLIARLVTDPVWYFYQFWFPKYLSQARGLPQDQLTITWTIYAAAGAGSLLGGWLSGRLIRRGIAPAPSRLWIMLGCALVMPLSPLITRVDNLGLALTLTLFPVAAALAWLINVGSLVVDLVPKHSLGTVFSVVATGSTIGGILMNLIVAAMVSGVAARPVGFLERTIHAVAGGVLELVQGRGYAAWFWIMAFLHPLAWLFLYFGRMQGVPRAAVAARAR